MKFIKIGSSIFETTNVMIYSVENYGIYVANLSGNTTISYESKEERDAEFDRIEELLIPKKRTWEEFYKSMENDKKKGVLCVEHDACIYAKSSCLRV